MGVEEGKKNHLFPLSELFSRTQAWAANMLVLRKHLFSSRTNWQQKWNSPPPTPPKKHRPALSLGILDALCATAQAQPSASHSQGYHPLPPIPADLSCSKLVVKVSGQSSPAWRDTCMAVARHPLPAPRNSSWLGAPHSVICRRWFGWN